MIFNEMVRCPNCDDNHWVDIHECPALYSSDGLLIEVVCRWCKQSHGVMAKMKLNAASIGQKLEGYEMPEPVQNKIEKARKGAFKAAPEVKLPWSF